jgi:two-component system sensor histidine kinase UhpB
MLEDLGLAATIEWQAEEFARRSGIECELRQLEDLTLPRGRVPLGMFRVLQEALDNVRRHSGATKVTVDFEREGGDAVLRVADNGRGFAEDEARKPGAIGLTGIRERVQSWGGRVTIDSSVGAGTVLEATAPLEDEPAGKTAPESSPI